jgi:two-component system, OmpR family, KDP operon response regulator KdpE
MTLRVLVIEDDQAIRSMLQSTLTVEGFEVRTAVSVGEARALLRHAPPDLVREARQQRGIPVLVVSARHQESEKVKLLDAGADDYLTKPFSVGELLARIRVAMRHRGTALSPAVTVYESDGLRVDLDARRVEARGWPVHLTPTEFKLLARLVRAAGKVVTHRQMLADVWGQEFVEHTHYLRLYMGQLRAKIEEKPDEPRYLLTETGVGYRLALA